MSSLEKSRTGFLSSVVLVMTLLLTMFVSVPQALASTETSFADANGNTVNFVLTVFSDGTGHETSNQCYINAKNGYALGDNTATDGYVCTEDTITYRVDWSANIKDASSQPTVNFNFSNLGTYPNHLVNFNYTGGGVTGGTALGYTGSGNATRASMTFTQTGTLSGYWTFNVTPINHIVSSMVYDGTVDLNSRTTFGGQTKDVRADRPVHVLYATRLDVRVKGASIEPGLTTIDGATYRGVSITSNVNDNGVRWGVNDNTFAVQYPGYVYTKGYPRPGYGSYRPMWDFPEAKWSVDNAPAGMMFELSYWDDTLKQMVVLDPVPAQYDDDGSTAFVDAPVNYTVKALFPWSAVPNGTTQYQFRIDQEDRISDLTGNYTLEGNIDPGVGLTCSTTTANVVPGSRIGGNVGYPTNRDGFTLMPNNNCGGIQFYKAVGTGAFSKVDSSDYLNINGERYSRTRVAGNNSWSFFTGTLTLDPPPASNNLSTCMAWNQNFMQLASDNNVLRPITISGRPIQEVFPDVIIRYSTNLPVPSDRAGQVNCGSPTDATLWSTTIPADTSEINAIMFTFPGQDTLLGRTAIAIPLATESAEKYPQLLNQIWNFGGYSYDTTVDNPVWRTSVDGIQVAQSMITSEISFDSVTDLRIGEQEVVTDINYNAGLNTLKVHGFNDPRGYNLTQRIYLDSCIIDPRVSTKAPNMISWEIHGEPSDTCGLSESYYIDVEWSTKTSGLPLQEAQDYKLQIIWSTPADTMPGEEISFRSTFMETSTEKYLFSNTTRDKTYTVARSAVVGSTKTTSSTHAPIDGEFHYTIGWYNFTEVQLGHFEVIDILPYNGDGRGTSYSGSYWLTGVDYASRTAQESHYLITNTPSASINSDPRDPSNRAGGSTIWCSVEQLGETGCPSSLAQVTAIKFVQEDFGIFDSQFYRMNFDSIGNEEDDVYVNNLGIGHSDRLEQPIPASPNVQVDIYANSVTGNVYNDTNKSYDRDGGEAPIANALVQLYTSSGTLVESTYTNSEGNYIFPRLYDGDYYITVTPVVAESVAFEAYMNRDTNKSNTFTLLNTDLTEVDFGFYTPASISGVVYRDSNANSTYDNERIFAEIPVELLDADGNVIQTTLTNMVGKYEFKGLDAGTYTVRFPEFEDSRVTQVYGEKNTSGIDSLSTQPIAVGEGEDVTGVDYGHTYSSIHYEVYVDGLLISDYELVWNGLTGSTDDEGKYSMIDVEPGASSDITIPTLDWARLVSVEVDGEVVLINSLEDFVSATDGERTVKIVYTLDIPQTDSAEPPTPVFDSGM